MQNGDKAPLRTPQWEQKGDRHQRIGRRRTSHEAGKEGRPEKWELLMKASMNLEIRQNQCATEPREKGGARAEEKAGLGCGTGVCDADWIACWRAEGGGMVQRGGAILQPMGSWARQGRGRSKRGGKRFLLRHSCSGAARCCEGRFIFRENGRGARA